VEGKIRCQISLDIEKCEVCGDCVDTCPTEVLVQAESDGREVAEVVDADECIGCESCVAVCAEEAITITEV
jgi:ferredoxin